VIDFDHLPSRPSWECSGCGLPWPCDPAREYLATTLTTTWLAVYCAANLGEAALDLPSSPPAELHERFLGWVRPAHP
jgi:hypothetical protein